MAKKDKYIDLDLDFKSHPLGGDVTKKYNEEAIKRSLKNLILTDTYDRPFHPELSSGVQGLLFENVTPVTAQLISNRIRDTLVAHEPRIELIDVAVDPEMDNNHYGVTVAFRMRNTQRNINLTMVLQRIR